MKLYKIYIIVFPNNKFYIGQTTRTLPERFQQHKSAARNSGRQCKIYSAFRKYDNDKIYIKLLHEEICDNDYADELEKYYIKLYDSYKSGYNSTTGGSKIAPKSDDWRKTNSENRMKYFSKYGPNISRKPNTAAYKPVVSISQHGEIEVHTSISHASSKLGLNPSDIVACCKGRSKTTKGYFFIYEEKLLTETFCFIPNPEYKVKPIKPKSLVRVKIPVLCFTLDGIFVREYESIADAAKDTGTSVSNIVGNIQGKRYSAGRHKWEYKTSPT